MTEIPTHVFSRIAEDVSKELDLEVSAEDVEFILSAMTPEGNLLLSSTDVKRWYGFDTYVRSSVYNEAKEYGF